MVVPNGALLSLLLASPLAAQLFPTPVFPASGFSSRPLAVDLDGDGHIDTAVTDTSSEVLIIQHGDGHGLLATVASLPSGGTPAGLSAGDVTGHGKPDLIVALGFANRLALFESLGGSAYADPVLYYSPGHPSDVELADLDGDGDPDAATANAANTQASVLLNEDGRLGPAHTYGTLQASADVAVSDLDLDGDLDVVVTLQKFGLVKQKTGIAWLPNDGTGTLLTGVMLENGAETIDMLAIADFDENGWPDLAGSASFSDEGLPVFFGQGGGAFGPVQHLSLFLETGVIGTADLDADGHADLMLGASDGAVAVVLGDGAGSFKPHGAPIVGGNFSSAVPVAADLDEDGCLDLLATASGPGVAVLRGDGFGNFPQPLETPVHLGADGLRARDIDLDGLMDVVTASLDGTLSWLRGHGDGTFTELVLDGGDGSHDVDAADIDLDGTMDIVAADYYGGQVIVHQGDGTLTFPAPTALIPCGPGHPASVALGDVGAGAPGPDIVLTAFDVNWVGVIGNDGAGGWLPIVKYSPEQWPDSVQLADLEPDGDLDIVYVRHDDSTLGVLRNSAGTLTGPESYPLGVTFASPGGVALGDLNEDGQPDAVSCNGKAVSVSVLLGTSGGFQTAVVYKVRADAPRDIEIADVDGDAHLDAVLACPGDGVFAILRGDGLGHLQTDTFYCGMHGPSRLALADFDGDGSLDVVTNESYGPDLVTNEFYGYDELALSLSSDLHAGAWCNLGSGLAGAAGTPKLLPAGTLEPSTSVSLALTGAAAGSSAALILGLAAIDAPFKGGILVPSPDAILAGLTTGPAGDFTAAGTLPAGVPSGVTIHAQFWIVDAGGPKGFAASNAVVGTTP